MKSSRSFLWLLALLGALVPAPGFAGVPSLPIANPSFESDAIQGANAPAFEIRAGAPTGWQYLPGTASSGLLAPQAAPHAFYPDPTPGIDGAHVFFLSHSGGLSQTLPATLAANTTYTLTVSVGTRSNGNFGGFHFKLDTLSGPIVGDWVGANRNFVAPGKFGDFSRTFTTGPNPPGQNGKLRLTISQPDVGPTGSYTDVDNIRLTAEPASHPHLAGQPIDVLIVAGQSNAQGWQANAAQLSPGNRHYADTPNPDALLSYRERNLPDPLDSTGSMAALCPQGPGFANTFVGFGPELALGTDVADASRKPVAVIKYAIGSAGLNADFKKTNHKLYPALTAFVTASLQQLRDQGYAPVPRAVFWLQGETDSGDHPELYGTNIADFAHDLRQDLNAPDLKFYLTEINVHMPALAPNLKGVAAVNQGMKDLAAKDPLVHFIPLGDITSGFADSIHYSADQQIIIGQRWAKAYGQSP